MSWLPMTMATGAWIVASSARALGWQRRVEPLVDDVAGDDDEIGLERVGLGDHLLEVRLDVVDVLADVNVRQVHDVDLGAASPDRRRAATPRSARAWPRRSSGALEIVAARARSAVASRAPASPRPRSCALGRRQRDR